METVTRAEAARVGLAVVDPPFGAEVWLTALAPYQLRATFFVRPNHLVEEMPLWTRAVAAGHEIGNGALLGVTDDGRLRNWTCAALEAELRDGDRIIRELGQTEVDSVVMPGRFHVCAEGRYAPKLHRAFPLCLGETERLTVVKGRPCKLGFSLAARDDRDAVLFLYPAVTDLSFLLPHAAAVSATPLRDMLRA